jgi:hypothetical protein
VLLLLLLLPFVKTLSKHMLDSPNPAGYPPPARRYGPPRGSASLAGVPPEKGTLLKHCQLGSAQQGNLGNARMARAAPCSG